MAQVKQGDNVKIHYTGKLEDGTVFDSSVTRGEPIEFTVGDGRLLPDFETGVIGMSPGESKHVAISHEHAYGPYRDEMVIALPRNQIPENLNVEVGLQLQLTLESGQPIIVNVTDISESTVTLDANHPLAGQNLNFELQLLEIM
jgi:peptidylprolyl isomerase